MKHTFLALLMIIALVAVGCGEAPHQAGTSEPTRTPESWAKTPVTVVAARSAALNSAINELKGKVIVVDFWATWCGPCVEKFPRLVELQKKFGDRGLVCVSVSLDKFGPTGLNLEKVKSFLENQDARFPNFAMIDPEADQPELHKRYGLNSGIPFLAILDRNGQPVWNNEDNVSSRKNETQEIYSVLEKLLDKK